VYQHCPVCNVSAQAFLYLIGYAIEPAYQRFFGEREAYMLSPVRLSVVCLSVTFVHPTKAVQIFGNISTALGTLATH